MLITLMDTIYHRLELTFSAASSYQEWFQVKSWASKWDQAFIFLQCSNTQLKTETGIYSEEAFI